MHRTVNISTLNSEPAEVNGTKPKSLRTGRETRHRQQKSRARKTNLTRLCRLSIGVLSDDFATVDVREELCKTKPPEKANSEGLLQSDNHSEETAGKK